jgi:hypothetical protein
MRLSLYVGGVLGLALLAPAPGDAQCNKGKSGGSSMGGSKGPPRLPRMQPPIGTSTNMQRLVQAPGFPQNLPQQPIFQQGLGQQPQLQLSLTQQQLLLQSLRQQQLLQQSLTQQQQLRLSLTQKKKESLKTPLDEQRKELLTSLAQRQPDEILRSALDSPNELIRQAAAGELARRDPSYREPEFVQSRNPFVPSPTSASVKLR